jgi:DNA-binding FadR family transcriptional regulator
VIESGRGPEGITVPIPPSKREQIVEDLIGLVRSGDVAPGAAIPSAAQLMEQYDCSISPVRDAIRELKIRGLLTGVPGRAVYVADPLPGWLVL